jgi:predicted nucleic-acid-binding Zn-ribbon protein
LGIFALKTIKFSSRPVDIKIEGRKFMEPQCPKCGMSDFLVSETDVSTQFIDSKTGEITKETVYLLFCSNCGAILGQRPDIDMPKLDEVTSDLQLQVVKMKVLLKERFLKSCESDEAIRMKALDFALRFYAQSGPSRPWNICLKN